MPNWIRAGIAYFAVVFAIGFLLGIIRVTLVVPRVGLLVAVAFEVPLMVSASWIVCRRLVQRFGVAGTTPLRLGMGAVAFGILMIAEAALAVFLMGQSVAQHFASYGSAHAILGLAGQVAFALIPWVQRDTTKQSGVAIKRTTPQS